MKCSSAKSPSTSSYEYQSREKSFAPTGIRHSVKLAPTPGANSSRSTESRSPADSAESDVQPSSLKHAPNPSIACRGSSVCTNTSAPPPAAVSATRLCHGDVAVVTYHSAPAAGVDAPACPAPAGSEPLADRTRNPGSAEAPTSPAAPFTTVRRLTGLPAEDPNGDRWSLMADPTTTLPSRLPPRA